MNSEHIKLVRFTILVSSVHCLLQLAHQLVIEVLVESFGESQFTADCSNLDVGISVKVVTLLQHQLTMHLFKRSVNVSGSKRGGGNDSAVEMLKKPELKCVR